MHWIIPFAGPGPEAARESLRTLALPHLRALLAELAPAGRDDGDAWSLSPPHERALARARGWAGGDGELPFAAHAAAADGIDTGDLAWGLLTPSHWRLGTEQLSLMDPAALLLAEADSRTLFEAVQPLFTSEGFVLAWGAPLRWYAAHEMFAGLRSASLDRVVGRNVDAWLGADAAARRVRRLQAEVQMLLHTHPLNATREAAGLLPVNSVWLSGCGVAQPVAAAAEPAVDDRLRAPALAEDAAAWLQAWSTLDDGPLAEALRRVRAGEPVQLTLCGECHAATFAGRAGAWQRLRGRLAPPSAAALLESL